MKDKTTPCRNISKKDVQIFFVFLKVHIKYKLSNQSLAARGPFQQELVDH